MSPKKSLRSSINMDNLASLTNQKMQLLKHIQHINGDHYSSVLNANQYDNCYTWVIITLNYVQRLSKSPIKGTVRVTCEGMSKATTKHYLNTRNIGWY